MCTCIRPPENSPPGTPLQPVSGFGPLVQAAGWHLLATDHDVGANARIEYRLAGVPTEDGAEVTGVTNFSIDAASGVISTRVVFDREEAETYQIQVFAVDHGSPRLTGTGTVQQKPAP
ncbi:unnamed protein product [Protopolystoma xenopodis]|uniref:Cadherin domain-containing protein n=1 Tax=Protopolystoma xenopodis TaxID=117903 RepID=A0A448WE03_9PLAT|nr:unnamed protein product [Protopolystoma xenopodis]